MYTMITRNDCKYCDKAKALLKECGIRFTTFNIEEGSSKWVLSLMKEANIKTVPQVFASSGSLVGGFRELETFVESIRKKED
jgi:glutaredoxin|tara:strand:- start:1343 stop:1588 length:246 start_codon:yes stop_codon:yes gene_type:complete